MTQEIREQFEASAAARHMPIRRDGDSYFVPGTQRHWRTWQAAWDAALASHAPSEPSCVVCGALLLPPSEPPHCEDCHLVDGEAPSEAAVQPNSRIEDELAAQRMARVRARQRHNAREITEAEAAEIEHNDH